MELEAGSSDWQAHVSGIKNPNRALGMPRYDATRAEEVFCTEAEARAAGYRRAIVR
jgi:hypothetical protein